MKRDKKELEQIMEEERKKFLKAVWTAIDIWGRDLEESKTIRDPRDRMISCTYSILHILDNTHKKLPKYKLSFMDEDGNEIVISGKLHDNFFELDTLVNLRKILAEMYQ